MNAVRLDAERFSLRATDGLYVLSWLLCMTDGVLISYTTLNGADAARFVSLFLRVSALLVMLGKVIWDRKHRLTELLFTFAACSLLAVTLLRSGYNHL